MPSGTQWQERVNPMEKGIMDAEILAERNLC
jgi:hypothetical protein